MWSGIVLGSRVGARVSLVARQRCLRRAQASETRPELWQQGATAPFRRDADIRIFLMGLAAAGRIRVGTRVRLG